MELNGKKYDCPSCYEQLTTGQHQRIVSEWEVDKPLVERDWFKLFCILTGSEFKAFKPTPIIERKLFQAVRWFVEQPFKWSEDIPNELQIEGKTIEIPTDAQELSIGQNIHLRQIIDKSKVMVDEYGDPVEFSCYSHAVAIYLQPLYEERKFDFNRAMKLERVIAAMPAYIIRPLGFFILTNALRYGRLPKRNWLRTLVNRIEKQRRTLLTWHTGNGSPVLRTLV